MVDAQLLERVLGDTPQHTTDEQHNKDLMQLRQGLHMALVAVENVCINRGIVRKRKTVKH